MPAERWENAGGLAPSDCLQPFWLGARVICKRFVLLTLVVALIPGAASAQRRGRGATGLHRVEIAPFGGYTWTFGRDFYLNLPSGPESGRLDIQDSGRWGIALDINLPYKPGSQVQLLYNRQDSKLEWKPFNPGIQERTADFAVEYGTSVVSLDCRRATSSPSRC